MSHFPSTKSLRAFEAAARLGSIKAAADQLHITASAVSRRIQTLEAELGQALFVRDMQGVSLTAAGQYYAEQLRGIFKSLDQATAVVRNQSRRLLKVTGPAVVVKPCMDRLHSLEEALPGVDLAFQTAFVRTELDPLVADADIVFSCGNGAWRGWRTAPITHSTHFVPLCAPALLEVGIPFSNEALANQTWIIPANFEEGWNIWYQALGMPMPTPKRIMKVADAFAAAHVAQRGGGVWMGQGFNRYPNLSVMAGELAPAHAFHAFVPEYGIHIGTRSNDENPDLPKFAEWFFREVWNLSALQQSWRATQQ